MFMRTRTFDFAGDGGQRLSGRLDLPSGPVTSYVIFAHCFTCNKNSIAAVRIARALTARGFGVLRFDFTGLGQSDGDFGADGFSANVRDLLSAAGAMKRDGRSPTLLIGHSLGGAAVLAAAGELPDVAAVATVGAPAEVSHVTRLLGDGLDALMTKGDAEVHIGGRPFRIRRAFVEDLAAHDLAVRIKTLRRPLLILHAPRDLVVAIDNATSIFGAARHPKSFVSLDNADHLLTRGEDAEYVATVIAAWASRYIPPLPLRSNAQPGYVVVEDTGEGDFQVEVEAGGARFLADEPLEVGGLGSGPTPYDLLSAGLGACTAMTLRLYARRKGIKLHRATVRVGHERQTRSMPEDVFIRQIELDGDFTEEQRKRLMEIADRCPVHRTLQGGAAVRTEPAGDETPLQAVESPSQHAKDTLQLVA
jgi:putative redox protein